MHYLISVMYQGYLTHIDSAELGTFIKDGYLHLQNRSVPSPVFLRDNQVFVKAVLKDYTVLDLNIQITEDVTISHGMFLQISHINPKESYQIFIQERDTLKGKHNLYQLAGDVIIGRGNTARIKSLVNTALSSEHAVIRKQGNGYLLEDISKKAGIYVNNFKCISNPLEMGDLIWCMGMSIVYMGEYIGVSEEPTVFLNPYEPPLTDLNEKPSKNETFERSPRIIRSLEQGEFEIDPPTQKNILKSPPLILSIGPSLTMSMAMLVSLGVTIFNASNGGSKTSIYTSGAMACSMLLGAIMWPTLLKKYRKKENEQLEILRQDKYSAYIQEVSSKLEQRYLRNQEIWNDHLAPTPEKVALYPTVFQKENNRLWERKPSDIDFLDMRMGIGDHPFEVDIKIPRQGFSIDEDELKSYPKRVLKQFETLKNVPVPMSLQREKVVGIFGNTQGAYEMMEAFMIQTMALHSPEEVKTVFLFSEYEKEYFLWAKELPSVWNNDRSLRFMATTVDEAHEVLTYVDERVSDENPSEIYIIFVSNKELLEKEKINQYIQSPENEKGVYGVFLSEKISGLPKNCNAIIRSFGERAGFYTRNLGENKYVSFKVDKVDKTLVKNFGESMMKVPFTLEAGKLGVPERVGFLEMYHCGNIQALNIEEKWLNNRSHKSLATPIGLSTGNVAFELDIHESYHGCHGLVAGTTGSGKTEFLQEFILSLMVNYSPKEITFVLVDFKGGDMARPFMKSSRPGSKNVQHVAATITNLSTNMLYRALTSLKAEIQYRQRVFNNSASQLEIDKIDINSYQQYMKEGKLTLPLPHLVVVIDEFAQLKTQFPEFLQELINVAQVGRSLGIHLILATQKPTGVVDPQIWSNSRFKVCLKVSDKQDSNEMLHSPLAASIKQPGRCYVQVGYDELFAEVQTGYSGLEYISSERFLNSDELSVDLVDYSATKITSKKLKSDQNKTDRTQIEAVVAEIKKVGDKLDFQSRLLWEPLLEEIVYLEDISVAVGKKEVIIGLVDDIKNQKQYPYTIDFSKLQHYVIYGMSGQGKTTLLQSILFQLFKKNSSAEVESYIFDFAGPTMKYYKNVEHVKGFSDASDESEIEEMLSHLTEEVEHRKELFQKEDCTTYKEYCKKKAMSQIVVIIDNFQPFTDRLYGMQDSLRQILANSLSCGITFMITSVSKSGISSKITEHLSNAIIYKMPDKFDYRDLFRAQVSVYPEDVVGRCLVAVGKDFCELQTALVVKTTTEAERVQFITSQLPEKKAEEIKKKVEIKEKATAEKKERAKANASKPVSSGTSAPVRKIELEDLDYTEGMFISGTDPAVVEQVFLKVSTQNPGEYYFTPDESGEFAKLGGKIVWEEQPLDVAIEEIADRIRNRETVPCEISYIHIPSFSEFFAIVSDTKLDLLILMLRKYPQYVKVITADTTQKLAPLINSEMYTHAVKQKQGIITNVSEMAGQILYLRNDLVPPKVNSGFKRSLYFNQGKWNALDVEG